MLQNITIRNKVIFLLTLPVLALVFLSYVTMREKENVVNESEKVVRLMEISSRMSALVHEQQKERGMTSIFLNNQGTKLSAELKKQRLLTDKKRKIFLIMSGPLIQAYTMKPSTITLRYRLHILAI